MDTSGFFNYPTLPASEPVLDPGFLPDATEREWDTVLTATETLRFAPGDVVLRAGDRDRAFYLLLDGTVEPMASPFAVSAPATLGAVSFLDGSPRSVTLLARTHGEMARGERLGRAILVDLGRGLGARLRAAGHAVAGWTG